MCDALSDVLMYCNAFLERLSFAMPYHQIVESYLIARQESLVVQILINC